MYITNNDLKTIEAALHVITPDIFKQLDIDDQYKVIKADETLIQLLKKRERDNKRTAQYIAEKRKTNKNYAR